MQKFILLQIVAILLVQVQGLTGSGVYTADQLNNKTFKVLDANACKQISPDGCCFEDSVKITTESDGKFIKSLTFTGNQIGQNCIGSVKVIPAQQSEGQEFIQQGNFYVTDEEKKLQPYGLFSSYTEVTENGSGTATAEFDIQIPSQNGVVAQALTYTYNPSDLEGSEANEMAKTYSPLIQFMELISLVIALTYIL